MPRCVRCKRLFEDEELGISSTCKPCAQTEITESIKRIRIIRERIGLPAAVFSEAKRTEAKPK